MTHHILVVDDEPDVESLISQQFRKEIRKAAYTFSFARDGQDALLLMAEAKAQGKGVDMVLTDINMPVMDGLTMLVRINALAQPPKTVVMSAYGDMDNIRRAMNAGAFDFLTKPIERKDLALTIKRTLAVVEKEKAARAQLERAKVQLVQSEKMSALGQMVAGLAHEINNPVNFIYGNLKHARRYAQDLRSLVALYQQIYPDFSEEIEALKAQIEFNFLIQDIDSLFDSLDVGAVRIRELVLSLRNFSRLDESAQKEVDIHEGIDSTLLILSSRLQSAKQPKIVVEKAYGDLPLVECYPSQLNQVIMNLLSNAADALSGDTSVADTSVADTSVVNASAIGTPSITVMTAQKVETSQAIAPKESKIRIATEAMSDEWIRITVEDNGPGIEKRVVDKLFDPFFTTKPVGKGMGLGLSISYQIAVEKHRGRLYCRSTPGKGACFYLELPVSVRAAETDTTACA